LDLVAPPGFPTSSFVDEDTDKFHKPLRTKARQNLVPASNYYYLPEISKPKGGCIPATGREKHGYVQPNHYPGPQYYDAQLEPKKISFLFANDEKYQDN
jgi:hypothetical protein